MRRSRAASLGALLAEKDGVFVPLLQKLGADSDFASDCDWRVGPPAEGDRHTDRTQRTLMMFSIRPKEGKPTDSRTSTFPEHLLLGLAQVKSDARELLAVSGVNHQAILSA